MAEKLSSWSDADGEDRKPKRGEPARLRRKGMGMLPTVEQVEKLAALRSEGLSVEASCKETGIALGTFYRWRDRFVAKDDDEILHLFGERVLCYDRKGKVRVPTAPGVGNAADFVAWATGNKEGSKPLILDSGEPFVPESWELDPVEDYLSGNYKAVLLVVPEANGKTTLTASIVLYLLEHQLTPEIPIGSATTTQAETLFRQIEGFIVRSDKLQEYNLAAGIRRIDCRKTHGHTRVYPHNEKSGDGVIPSASVLDEAHLHPNLRLYRVWKGKWRKRHGAIMVISTAGEPGSEFEELRAKILREGKVTKTLGSKGQYVRAELGDTVLHDWAVRDPKDEKNFEVVAEANPLMDVDAEELEVKFNEPEMTEEHWLRRTCNIPTRMGAEGISAIDWDRLYEKDLKYEDGKAYGWLDLGWKIDTTSIGVLVWVSKTRRLILDPLVIEPPVSESDVVQAMVERQERYPEMSWVFDPNAGGQQMAQLLEEGEHPKAEGIKFEFIEHSQDNTPMALAASRLDEAIREGWFAHDGDRTMRTHVLNAAKKPLGGEKYKYERPAQAKGEARGRWPIDALTGLLMANSVAVTEDTEKPKELLLAVVRR